MLLISTGLDEAINFYDSLLDTLDLKRVYNDDKYVGYAPKNNPENIEFYVTKLFNKEKKVIDKGIQIYFVTN